MLAAFLLPVGTLKAQVELGPPTPSTAQAAPESAPGGSSRQMPLADMPATPTAATPLGPIVDPQVQQTSGCCGVPPLSPHSSCGCNGSSPCVPGRQCPGYDADTPLGRLLAGFYDCLCCPDPCYQPRWLEIANAAFFQDAPRPATLTRVRWDAVYHYLFPDTAEFFWAQIGTKGPRFASPSLRYGELSLYQEVAAKGASVFIEMPYLSVLPDNDASAAGFGDLNAGVKTTLLDRELVLITTQFRTYAPIGNFSAGFGTGHVSLEPSIMAALKITAYTYFQTQLAYWIPVGGTSGFEGSTFHYHFSLNQLLCHHGDAMNIVGTLEFNGFSYRGQYTDFPSGTRLDLAGTCYYNAGPGIRVQFCDRFDLGFGAAFGFGNLHGPGQIYRTDIRVRF
jgi:hypothetical protein